MIPILFEGNETAYTTNGIGRLTDAISCNVTEELNGPYELTMRYPITGIRYEDLEEGKIILAEPFEGGTWQPFTIYRISRPLNGVVTVNAEHISYLLNKVVVMPYSATSCAQALASIPANTANTCPFTFTTDKTVTGAFSTEYPRIVRGLLGGEQGSILDVYGKGEYFFDRFNVHLYTNRGRDNGVTIRYGKNLTELVRESNIQNVYTGIVPYWRSKDERVTLPEMVVWSQYRSQFAYDIVKPVDFTSNWQDPPTASQLRAVAEAYVENNEGWKLSENIKISFVALWQTEEYKQIANVERVRMGDTVHVIYDALGVDVAAEVIRTEYDAIRERYREIQLGAKKNNLATVIKNDITPAILKQASAFTSAAVANATDLITGANGGHVVIGTNADGQPNEIYIMDTDDIETATKVIRMNMNGIGFSTNGYEGPFTTAWTIDGAFVADFITTGTLNANLIKAGTIQDTAGKNYWNMTTGEFSLSANTMVGNSTVATVSDVNGAKSYADSVAGSAESAAKSYADTVANAVKQIADSKITTYYQSGTPTDPSTGDLWINTTGNKNTLSRYNGTQWVAVDNADIAKAIQDAATAQLTADGKIVTFAQASQPTASSEGDIWIDTDDQNKLYRWDGYSWIPYRDGQIAAGDAATLASAETYADGAISTYDQTVLTQTGVFNKLTVNGTKEGIYMDSNGNLYVNASYIKSGTLSLGGANNVNGTMIVYDASGNEIGHWNNAGVYIKNGEIYQEQYVDASVGTGWLRIQSTEITGGYTELDHTATVDLQDWQYVTDTSTGEQYKEGVLSLRCTNGSIALHPDHSIYLQAPNEINILSEAGVAVAYANLTTGAITTAVAVAPQGVALVTPGDSGLIINKNGSGYAGTTKTGTRFADRGDGVHRTCDIVNGIICNLNPL